MLTIPGYDIFEQIHAGRNSLVFRGMHLSGNRPVILKVPAREYPSARELARFFNEFEILQTMDVPGVVRVHAMEKVGHGHVLILEDFDARPLSQLLDQFERNIELTLELALSLVGTLERIHARGIVHKDIKLENILINRSQGQIKLTDFGIASLISRESQSLQNPDSLEGTLEYMSPEQTGRINRAVDYRSDYYSLGVVLYRLLTGGLPFPFDDPLELVHAHIARVPTPPIDKEPGIPLPLSAMVMKLLAKTPEERYQSAAGIREDLRRCLTEFNQIGTIAPFTPGQSDHSEQLRIPQKLYGRESEIQRLLRSFDIISSGHVKGMVLVGGYSGIGKSALVKEIHRPLLERRGYFISGKYDQFRRDVPCLAIIQAFQELVRQLLTESSVQIAAWKRDLLDALGPNGQVMIDVIPDLELIIGAQPEVDRLSPVETRNRFNATLRFMVRAMARENRPITLFLDDLQWADLTSFELLDLLLSDRSLKHLLIIGAFRDNEVGESHPLEELTRTLEKKDIPVDTISLAPLSEENVNELMADTLHLPPERVAELSALIHEKTGGNPYFISEFVRTLADESLVRFDPGTRAWSWSLDRIRTMDIAENVVELMHARIQKLPVATRAVLEVCACLGSRFDLQTLALVLEKTQDRTAVALDIPLREGLLIPLDDSYKYVAYAERTGNADINPAYKFAHDRVQQAAYSLLNEWDRHRIHYSIGGHLLQRALAVNDGGKQLEEESIEIAGHLNQAHHLMTEDAQRLAACELNLVAGKRARDATAYNAAIQLFEAGFDLLPEDGWKTNYDLTLEMHDHLMEAAYLVGSFERMDAIETLIKSNARQVMDTVKACQTRMLYHTAHNRMLEAVYTALDALRILGVHLPRNPKPTHLFRTLMRTRLSQGLRSIDDIADLPPCEDPRIQAIMKVVLIAIPPAYVGSPYHMILLALTGVRLSFRHGYTPEGCLCFATYGVIQAGKLHRYHPGHQLGEAGLRLAERPESGFLQHKIIIVQYGFLSQYRSHLRDCLPVLSKAIQMALESGDHEYVGWGSMFYTINAFFAGRTLPECEESFRRYIEFNENLRVEAGANFMRPLAQLTLNLQGRAADRMTLKGDFYDGDLTLPGLIRDNYLSAVFSSYYARMLLHYHFGDLETAGLMRDEGENFIDSVMGMPIATSFYFYACLIDLARHEASRPGRRGRIPRKARENLKILRNLSSSTPDNFAHKYDLLRAEVARLEGRAERAWELYDLAIAGAREKEYIQEEALACELAAQAYLRVGRENVARAYMHDARYAYTIWGAGEMVRYLEETYPELLRRGGQVETGAAPIPHSGPGPARLDTAENETTRDQDLDLQTALKTSQAISSEIKLDRLLQRFMEILIENAGATGGQFIMEAGGRLFVRARGTSESGATSENTPVTDNPDVFENLIQYVVRTGDPVVVNDFATDTRFTGDSYLERHRPQSVLCASILPAGDE